MRVPLLNPVTPSCMSVIPHAWSTGIAGALLKNTTDRTYVGKPPTQPRTIFKMYMQLQSYRQPY